MPKTNTDIKALQLAARFALPPNSMGYCGRDSAPEKFKDCISYGNCDGVEEEITKFIVFNPYLKTISKIASLPVLSYEVVESYCIGNNKLKKAKPKHFSLLLDNFLKQGVPDFFVKELKQKPPKSFIPHHLFQVLYIGVGKASGAVPFNLESINNCMIRWGKVRNLDGKTAVINLRSLKKENGKYKLHVLQEKASFSKQITPDLNIGNTVAVHWKQVIKMLTDQEVSDLSYWTGEVLKTIN